MASFFPLFFTLLILSSTVHGINADDTTEEEAESSIVNEQNSDAKQGVDSDGIQSLMIGPSSDVQTAILFTSQPLGNRNELVTSQIVKFLVGFLNKGEKDFVVKHCETSFRYPLDFSYHIQNFSSVFYGHLVQPKQEATFDYAFVPSDSFVGRPLGLVVNLHYVDSDGLPYVNTVFNETITIIEDEASFQSETYFLYVIIAGFFVLVLFIIQHFLSKLTRKSAPSYQSTYEVGTNKNQVDYEWIPRSHLEPKKNRQKLDRLVSGSL